MKILPVSIFFLSWFSFYLLIWLGLENLLITFSHLNSNFTFIIFHSSSLLFKSQPMMTGFPFGRFSRHQPSSYFEFHVLLTLILLFAVFMHAAAQTTISPLQMAFWKNSFHYSSLYFLFWLYFFHSWKYFPNYHLQLLVFLLGGYQILFGKFACYFSLSKLQFHRSQQFSIISSFFNFLADILKKKFCSSNYNLRYFSLTF